MTFRALADQTEGLADDVGTDVPRCEDGLLQETQPPPAMAAAVQQAFALLAEGAVARG